MTQTGTPSGWQDYVELEKLTRALADKVRLNIVRILANSQQEVNVTDLTQQLLISQPLVSWHLAILRRNGLVRTRRQGRQVYCSLDVERYDRCLRMLADVVTGNGDVTTTAATEAGETEGETNASTGPATRRATKRTVGRARADESLPAPEFPRAASAESSDIATTARRPQTQAPR